MIQLLRERASDAESDVSRLVEAFVFNWMVGATDGHAKNYSIVLAPEGLVALSPLYDLATAAPYPLQIPWQRMRLAMKLGGEYRMSWVRRRHLDRLGEAAAFSEGTIPERAQQLGELILDRISEVRRRGVQAGLDERQVNRWCRALGEHVARCLVLLTTEGSLV